MQKKISTSNLPGMLLSLFIFLLNYTTTFGACTWTTTGASTNWTTAAAWTVTYSGPGPACSATPPTNGISSGDRVVINHTINLTSAIYDIDGNGSLILNATGTFNLTGSMEWSINSNVNVTSGSQLNISGNLANNNNSTGITVNGTVTVGGNMTAGSGSSVGPVDSGTGSISVSGTITTSGTATIFGSTADCSVSPCVTTSASALPVELLYISANCSEQNVQIKWQTASEFNSSHYIVKRSRDGIEWEEIGRLGAAGYSVEVIDYEFIDLVPYSSTSYYKVSQHDINGEFVEYSSLSVYCEQNTERIVVYPNPSEKEFHIQFNDEQMGEVISLILTDARGIVVHKQELKVEKGTNDILFNDLNLVPGVYNVQIMDGSHLNQTVLFMR
jgi:hypothetical protein